MWLLRILLLSILASGCISFAAPPRDGGSIEISGREIYWEEEDFPLWVVIDDQLPIEHINAALVATDSWNTAVGSEVFVPVIRDHTLPAPRAYGYVSVSMRTLGNSGNGNRILGIARAVLHRGSSHMQASEVWFDTGLQEEILLIVMVHELGHALTLEHDNDCTSVMHPTVVDCSGIPFIRPEDTARVQGMMSGDRVPVNADTPMPMDEILPEVWRHICIH